MTASIGVAPVDVSTMPGTGITRALVAADAAMYAAKRRRTAAASGAGSR